MNDTTANKQISALVVFAGASVDATVTSISWAIRCFSIDGLYIYHTESCRDKAERLLKFCFKQWPKLKTVLHAEPGDSSPEKVAERLRDWRIMRPDVTDWIVDCTGAELTMLAAVSRVVCESGGRIVSRAADGRWMALGAASGGRLINSVLENGPIQSEANGLDIPSFLELVATKSFDLSWSASRMPVRLTAEQLAGIIGAGTETNWVWRDCFLKGTGKHAPSEWNFEDFLGSTLLALGLKSVRVNVAVSIKGGKQPVEQTYDVVAIRNGEIWTFDCEINSDGDNTASFDLSPWSLFGQRVVAVRPERHASRTESMLEAKNRIVLDTDDCRAFFSCLASMLGAELPQAFAGGEKHSLSRAATSKLPVFVQSSQSRQFSEAMHLNAGIFDLWRGAEADNAGNMPPWCAVKIAKDTWVICGTQPKQVTPSEGRQRLAASLSRSHIEFSISFFEMSANKFDWVSVITAPGNHGAFAKWLGRWNTVPLWI